MSKYSCFDIRIKDHICNMVLNRPNELNTMTRDFWVELGDALEEINRDSDIRVVILSSTSCIGEIFSARSSDCQYLLLVPLPSKINSTEWFSLQ